MPSSIDPCYSYFSCDKPKSLLTKEQQQQDRAYMQQTFAVSPTSAIEEVPVQAMITHPDFGVLSQAYSGSIALHDPTAHAEILAIRRAADKLQNYRLIGCTLYASLEPCFMCFYALMHARIDRIVFAASDLRVGVLSQDRYRDNHGLHNHHFSWTGGVLAEHGQSTLKQFFSSKRK